MLAFRPGRWVVGSALCAVAFAIGMLFGGAQQAAGWGLSRSLLKIE